MFGKIIGAIAGAKAGEHARGIGGTGGALLGMAVPTLLRRMSPLGLVAVAAGGYALKRYRDRQESGKTQPRRRTAQPKVKPSAT